MANGTWQIGDILQQIQGSSNSCLCFRANDRAELGEMGTVAKEAAEAFQDIQAKEDIS